MLGLVGVQAAVADPRIAEASALLGDDAQWPRALELYAAALEDDPQSEAALAGLARLHAWRQEYADSLRHYDALLALPEPPPYAAIERAEVLSWSGRSEEAEAAFREILGRDPDNPRATRGLARVHRWSGRPADAARSYERALALEEDPEARAELEAMHQALGVGVVSHTSWLADSDDYSKVRATAQARVDLGFRTRALAEVGLTRLANDRSDPGPASIQARNHQTAFVGLAGVEYDLTPRLTGSLELGGIRWSRARDRFAARLTGIWRTPVDTVATVRIEHGDALDLTDSIDVVTAGVHATTVGLSAWHPVAERIGAFAQLQTSFLGDASKRVYAGASVDYAPFRRFDLRVGAAASYLHYSQRSDVYYDPETDTGGSLFATLRQPVRGGLALWVRGTAGYGYADQDGVDGQGFTFAVDGGPRWQGAGGWHVDLRGHLSRSQRASVYRTRGASLDIGKEF